ncbi:MAG TPA: hypothetical protein VMW05_03465 [Methyloceanibacter sp.]|nr:hypothetical protein [Methyloceanibacter sp.]
MTPTTLAWLALIAYALHIMEEFAFDWRDWARGVIHFLPLPSPCSGGQVSTAKA